MAPYPLRGHRRAVPPDGPAGRADADAPVSAAACGGTSTSWSRGWQAAPTCCCCRPRRAGRRLSVPALHRSAAVAAGGAAGRPRRGAAFGRGVTRARASPDGHGPGCARADPSPRRAVRRDGARLFRDLPAGEPAALARQRIIAASRAPPAAMPASPTGRPMARRDILSWRRRHAWLFLEAERVICPSEDARGTAGTPRPRRPRGRRAPRTGRRRSLGADPAACSRAASCGSRCWACWRTRRARRPSMPWPRRRIPRRSSCI